MLLIDVLTGSARPPHELAEKGWGHEGDQVGRILILAALAHRSSIYST
jgi:hypothetical protein